MTTLNFADAGPLRTAEDVLDRVVQLVGRAETTGEERTLWLMLADGDGAQLPTVLPISGVPSTPDQRGLDSLERILRGLGTDLTTARGPGSAFFTLERGGTDTLGSGDLEWASRLRALCTGLDLAILGCFLCTPAGVRAIP
jgi:hypothetical protein